MTKAVTSILSAVALVFALSLTACSSDLAGPELNDPAMNEVSFETQNVDHNLDPANSSTETGQSHNEVEETD